jgi:hypothetical protein
MDMVDSEKIEDIEEVTAISIVLTEYKDGSTNVSCNPARRIDIYSLIGILEMAKQAIINEESSYIDPFTDTDVIDSD